MNKILTKIIEKAYAQELISCPDGTMADPSIGCVQVPSAIVNPESGLLQIVFKITSGFMSIIAGIAIIFVIYGGIKYATAVGDEEQVRKVKRILFWSILGLIIALLATFVTGTVLDVVT